MRHYARNIGDLAAATRGLDLLHRGAYDALLDAYYLNERPLPADARECYLLADARSPAERRAVDACLARFFVLQADGYHQKRCDAELARWAAKSAGASSAVNLRWERERQAKAEIEQQKDNERSADVIRTYNERSTSVVPPTNHEPRTTKPTPRPPAVGSPPLPAKAKASAGTRLPAEWELPAEWGEWARHERPEWDDAQIVRTSLKFRDYWHGLAGARSRKADWLATWRNWVRSENSSPQSKTDARETRRSASVADILGAVNHDPKAADHDSCDPRDITGEAVRVA